MSLRDDLRRNRLSYESVRLRKVQAAEPAPAPAGIFLGGAFPQEFSPETPKPPPSPDSIAVPPGAKADSPGPLRPTSGEGQADPPSPKHSLAYEAPPAQATPQTPSSPAPAAEPSSIRRSLSYEAPSAQTMPSARVLPAPAPAGEPPLEEDMIFAPEQLAFPQPAAREAPEPAGDLLEGLLRRMQREARRYPANFSQEEL